MKKVNYILQKPLPNCPVGRIFKPTNDGDKYFLSITDAEWIGGKIEDYSFRKDAVINNPDWFKIEDESDMLSQIDNLENEKINIVNKIIELRKNLMIIKHEKSESKKTNKKSRKNK